MHLGLSALLEFQRTHQSDEALVLGTVIATEGSTYRKPGAMMLIAADNSYCGLISGGCLEADLAAHAKDVFADGKTRNVVYDMSHGDDFAWGLGLGCDGIIHLMLQRLDGNSGFGFLDVLTQALEARCSGLLSLVTKSDDPAYSPGDFAVSFDGPFKAGDPGLIPHPEQVSEMLSATGQRMSRRYWQEKIDTSGGEVDVLLVPVTPQPSVLICGAGHDALPVARLGVEMGWEVTIVDHRSGFARADRFPDSCRVLVLQPDELAQTLALQNFDAAVLMTHHLGHDRAYLSQVVNAEISYIGLLGPRARRNRLLEEIGEDHAHVYGPAGLDIGAEMPESIALAIVAEIHAHLNQRSGVMLTSAGT